MSEAARLREERDHLLVRQRSGLAWPRFTGRSSEALVRFAMTGEEPAPSDYPGDVGDLDSCREAMARMPRHLRTPAAYAMLVRFVEHTAASWCLRCHHLLNLCSCAGTAA